MPGSMQFILSHRTALLKRFLTSLAAIIAVTSIFAVKAAQWEMRAAAMHDEAPRLAKAKSGSAS